jgi:S-adenosylmethionine:tRNA ribosyltransferase-isomerase
MMMTEPEKISASDFHYNLPEENIAKYPLENREDSNLLVYNKGRITHDIFKYIEKHLPSDHLMVFNNAQVVYSRLLFQKRTGANIEIFCLEPSHPADYEQAFQQTSTVTWYCMVGNLKKWKGESLTKTLELPSGEITLKANKKERHNNILEIIFEWDNSNVSFSEILDNAGIVPIPPYLKRESEQVDKYRYQTVYSKIKGSVAAPTAGLHFSEPVMKSIKSKGIKTAEITLHVGAGTFRPVQTETVDKHEMHTEHFTVSKRTLEELIQFKDKILAVGTTSVRTLESLYWIGLKLKTMQSSYGSIILNQWEHRDLDDSVSIEEALESIITYLEKNKKEQLKASTQIMITPGYNFKLTKSMITNFHQPKSTLLMLIAAFVGDDWKDIYEYALKNNFRFLSYGDSSLLMP